MALSFWSSVFLRKNPNLFQFLKTTSDCWINQNLFKLILEDKEYANCRQFSRQVTKFSHEQRELQKSIAFHFFQYFLNSQSGINYNVIKFRRTKQWSIGKTFVLEQKDTFFKVFFRLYLLYVCKIKQICLLLLKLSVLVIENQLKQNLNNECLWVTENKKVVTRAYLSR